jgi:hypothetical protein
MHEVDSSPTGPTPAPRPVEDWIRPAVRTDDGAGFARRERGIAEPHDLDILGEVARDVGDYLGDTETRTHQPRIESYPHFLSRRAVAGL